MFVNGVDKIGISDLADLAGIQRILMRQKSRLDWSKKVFVDIKAKMKNRIRHDGGGGVTD